MAFLIIEKVRASVGPCSVKIRETPIPKRAMMVAVNATVSGEKRGGGSALSSTASAKAKHMRLILRRPSIVGTYQCSVLLERWGLERFLLLARRWCGRVRLCGRFVCRVTVLSSRIFGAGTGLDR